jgi:hypothetical protein
MRGKIMRRLSICLLAVSNLWLVACRDHGSTPVSGGLQSTEVLNVATGVAEGVHAPPQVEPGQAFQMAFTLRNDGGTAAGYDSIALAMIRPDGSHAYDAGKWSNISVPSGGTWTGNVVTTLFSNTPTGNWTVFARGYVAGTGWFNLTTRGGVNPRTLPVVTNGAFAALITAVNLSPSSVAPDTRPTINATIRNTSTDDSGFGGDATFHIRASVRRNGAVVQEQSWLSQQFDPGQTKTGFAITQDFTTTAPGRYDVSYVVRSGDDVHQYAIHQQSFWVDPPVSASCTPPPEATRSVSYAAFWRSPFGFRGATPWLSIVHQEGQSAASQVEIDYIRLWADIDKGPRIVSANEYENGIFGGQLADRSPWFREGSVLAMPAEIRGGVLIIRPSDHRTKVWHPYLELLPRVDINRARRVWMEARVRITGPALVQAGLDHWREVGGRHGDRMLETASGDWACASGVWQSIVLERSVELQGGADNYAGSQRNGFSHRPADRHRLHYSQLRR